MRKKLYLFSVVFVTMLALAGCGKGSDYKKAIAMYENGEYVEAARKFIELGDYENSEEMARTCNYEEAKELLKEGAYEEAIDIFSSIRDFKDSEERMNQAEQEFMHEKYADVFAALVDHFWYYNGGSDTTLNCVSFYEEEAAIGQVTFDGNGKHDNGSVVGTYAVDDKNIIITGEDGTEVKFPYSFSNGSVVLGNGEYFTIEEIEKGIQGYWQCTVSDTTLGMKTVTKDAIFFKDGKVKSEKAALANGSTTGEYYYFGPYEGSYEITFGGFKSDMRHGNEWFFNIIDGKVTILKYHYVCKPTDKLPGENGYNFK